MRLWSLARQVAENSGPVGNSAAKFVINFAVQGWMVIKVVVVRPNALPPRLEQYGHSILRIRGIAGATVELRACGSNN